MAWRVTLLLALIGSLCLAGCTDPPRGGTVVLTGTVRGTDLGLTDPPAAHFAGWNVRLDARTDRLNADMVDSDRCLFTVDIFLNSRERPDLYQRLSALADERGTVAGALMSFRATVDESHGDREFVVLTEIVDLHAAPAGDEWEAERCGP